MKAIKEQINTQPQDQQIVPKHPLRDGWFSPPTPATILLDETAETESQACDAASIADDSEWVC